MTRRTDGRRRELIGETLGSWRVEALIAEGGMGRVYRVRHVRDGRRAALKVLWYDYDDEADAMSRLFHEAKTLSEIKSPHLVRVYDFVQEGRLMAYSMEYLQGEDLGRVIVKEHVLTPARVVRIVRQVCDAMQAAHDKQIVHRDLKPENVFLVAHSLWADFVKVLDFGIAKYRYAVAHRTAIGAPVGSPWYMAPEQAVGLTEIDGRADQYSLGCIMYEALTGRVPFDGSDPNEVAHKQATMQPAPIGLDYGAGPIPEALSRVVLRCLAKDPRDRFPSMHLLAESIREHEREVLKGGLHATQELPSGRR